MPVQPHLFPEPPTDSPERLKSSHERQRDSPERQEDSPERSGTSLERSGTSPEHARTGPQVAGASEPPLSLGVLWMQRVSLFILVVFCVYLGVIMTVLPWWTEVWDHNLFFLAHPALWSVMRLGVTRGIVSGCGLLDIWIGISEAIHYREPRA
jgi:hypothetical protein